MTWTKIGNIRGPRGARGEKGEPGRPGTPGAITSFPGGGGGGGGFANPMTALDDLIVGGTAGQPGRLGVGADGQVLTVDPATHHVGWVNPTGGTGGGVSAVTATPPLQSTGGLAPNLSIDAATDTTPGSLSAADKAKLDA